MNEERLRSRGVIPRTILPGSLVHHQLVFNKRSSGRPDEGFANVVPSRNSLVEGILYDLDDRGFDILDRFEGFPVHYCRHLRTIVASSTSSVRAYLYVASPDMLCDGLRPSRSYLSHLLKGKPFLSDAYFQALAATPTSD